MKRGVKLAGLAGVVALALAPGGAQATHYCSNILILSGPGPVFDNGTAGCLVPGAEADTRYMLPGATRATVHVVDSPTEPPLSGGTITIGSTTTPLVFTYRHPAGSSAGRWESQVLTLNPLAPADAEATVTFGDEDDGLTKSVTYRAVP